MRNRALGLMYHRVAPSGFGAPDYSPVGMSVTPEEFSAQVEYIVDRYRVVPLEELVDALRKSRMPRRGMCAITFDDGWHDVYRFAFPVIKQFCVPATIFLTSGLFDGSAWFWEERAKFLLASLSAAPEPDRSAACAALAAAEPDVGFASMSNIPKSGLPATLGHVIRELKRLGRDRREHTVEMIERTVERLSIRQPRPFLSRAEIVEMSRYGVSFGHHTRSHPVLPELSDEEIDSELANARSAIAEVTGADPVDFAYPYGKFDHRVRDIVERHGFRSACSTRHGLCEPGDDRFTIKRINMASSITAFRPLFATRILGH